MHAEKKGEYVPDTQATTLFSVLHEYSSGHVKGLEDTPAYQPHVCSFSHAVEFPSSLRSKSNTRSSGDLEPGAGVGLGDHAFSAGIPSARLVSFGSHVGCSLPDHRNHVALTLLANASHNSVVNRITVK